VNRVVPFSQAGVVHTTNGMWRSWAAGACALGIAIGGILLGACSRPAVRPALGMFTGDEREVAYLDHVQRMDPTVLQTSESIHNALSFYRDTKFRQQALFLRFNRQYPQATPQEMATLVQDALTRETRSDLPNIPPPRFQCLSVSTGKTQSLSCN
jgi:hypothetical protein